MGSRIRIHLPVRDPRRCHATPCVPALSTSAGLPRLPSGTAQVDTMADSGTKNDSSKHSRKTAVLHVFHSRSSVPSLLVAGEPIFADCVSHSSRDLVSWAVLSLLQEVSSGTVSV